MTQPIEPSMSKPKYVPEFSFTVGKTIINYTPSGLWMHYVWQSTAPFICSGVKREKDGTYSYRFTRVGDSSIKLPGEGYNDIEIHSGDINSCRISNVLYSKPRNEVRTIGGWVEFKDQYNKKVLKQRLAAKESGNVQ